MGISCGVVLCFGSGGAFDHEKGWKKEQTTICTISSCCFLCHINIKKVWWSMKSKLNASYTVEAAFILPLVFALLYGIIFLGFYLHDHTIMQQCAWESAFYGAGQLEILDKSEIDDYLRERLKDRLLVSGVRRISIEQGDEEVTVELVGEASVLSFAKNLIGYHQRTDIHVKRAVPYPCQSDYVRKGLVISEQIKKLWKKE